MKIKQLFTVVTLGLALILTGCSATSKDSAAASNATMVGANVGGPQVGANGVNEHQQLSQAIEGSDDTPTTSLGEQIESVASKLTEKKTARPAKPEQAQENKKAEEPEQQNINDQKMLPPASGPAYPIAAMVGQVNGQAIYADVVFKPIDAQMKALSKRISGQQFVNRASQLIINRLRQIISDNLILGMAMRDLATNEKAALNHYVQVHRANLVRKYGRGSVALAQKNIKQQTGKTLLESVDDYRRGVVVRRYLHLNLVPRINVTRSDVRRYYHDNWDQFHHQVTRTLRIIRVDQKQDADKIAKQLAAGKSFAKIASKKPNSYNRDDGGAMGKQVGNELFRGKLNDAMLKLKAGQWAGPIKQQSGYWFVYVGKMTEPESKSLDQVQLNIRSFLRDRQFRQLSKQYRQKLFNNGSYNSIKQMTNDLVRIAISRYASGAVQKG